MNNQKRRLILERLRDDNPHPTTELNFTTPFELLIAVILSYAQTPQADLDLARNNVRVAGEIATAWAAGAHGASA